uniref:Uncharacterized protein n=1 Tax=Bracon brevicornis TaxID=1563983 RepID=A0A6V7L5G0_9HYME
MNITNSYPTCSQALRFESIRTLEAKISKLQNHMKTLLREDVVERCYRRDSAPVFGFISRILGPIVGFTDYEEHEHLVGEVKKLYEDKDQLAKVLNDSTHLLQSELDAHTRYLNLTSQNVRIL